MAFETRNLSVIAYANGFTLWHYATPDSAGDVDTTGYFDDASDMLRPGDMIIANCNTGGPVVSGFFHVSASGPGTVDVDDLTGVGGVDTD